MCLGISQLLQYRPRPLLEGHIPLHTCAVYGDSVVESRMLCPSQKDGEVKGVFD